MTNDQVQLEQPTLPTRPKSNRKWIALAIGGGCALLACGALAIALVVMLLRPVLNRNLGAPSPVPNIGSVPTQAGLDVAQSGNTIGDPNAPVKIVEYADYQCPYCRIYWQQTERQIMDKYVMTGKVFYEYRSVGAYIGEESEAAAEAAYCAADQGKFWQYHDTLYSHWTGENAGDFTPEKLQQYAAAIGLDQADFEKCLSSGKQAARVQQDVDNATSDGIKGTPSFLINGTIIEGAQPFDVFQQVIDKALQGK